MNFKTLVIASIATAGLLVGAGSAQAAPMVAGWDFSQYFGSGFLSTDAATAATRLSANYSDLDPTFGEGAESAAFGTFYYDGSFGSDNVAIDFSGMEAITPVTGCLASNAGAPVANAPGTDPFCSSSAFTVLANEGQTFVEQLAMRANAAVKVVFEADLSSLSNTGSGWEISLAGITEAGTSDVTFEVSTDGVNYSSVGTRTFTTTDTQYVLSLGSATDGQDGVFVRLGFDPVGLNLPKWDNVAISAAVAAVPEPGTALLGLAGLLGLGIFGRGPRA